MLTTAARPFSSASAQARGLGLGLGQAAGGSGAVACLLGAGLGELLALGLGSVIVCLQPGLAGLAVCLGAAKGQVPLGQAPGGGDGGGIAGFGLGQGLALGVCLGGQVLHMLLTLGDLAFDSPGAGFMGGNFLRDAVDIRCRILRLAAQDGNLPRQLLEGRFLGADGAPLGLQCQVPLLQRLLQGLGLAIEGVQRVVLLRGG